MNKTLLLILSFLLVANFVNAEVFINEFLANPSGTEPDTEWVELYYNGTGTVDLTGWYINDSIGPGYNLTGVLSSSNRYAIFNGTELGIQLNNGGDDIVLINASGDIIDSITYTTANEDEAEGRKGDGGSTIVKFAYPTSGAMNDDGNGPKLNKWIHPKDYITNYFNGVQNIQVNVTDNVYSVDSVNIEINGTNHSLTQNGDIWSYDWNTDIYEEGGYNFTLYSKDTLGYMGGVMVLNDRVYVDRTNPLVFGIRNVAENTRNYVEIESPIDVYANVTDSISPIKNVTASLQGTTIQCSHTIGDEYSCGGLTAPSSEGDYSILVTAEDEAGNVHSNSTTFTTKITTTPSVSVGNVVVSDLGTDDMHNVLVNVTVSNLGNSPMYDSNVELDSIEKDGIVTVASAISDFVNCNDTILDVGESCYSTFNITVVGGSTPSDYDMFWTLHWSDNGFNPYSLVPFKQSLLTIQTNPVIEVQDNASIVVLHGTNTTLTIDVNSTGNVDLNNFNVNYIAGSLPDSYVTLNSFFNNIPEGTTGNFDVTVAIPAHTYPGNYKGILQLTGDNAVTQTVDFVVSVPEDDSWNVVPANIDTYVKSSKTGIVGSYKINNTGNVDQSYTMGYSGSLYNYILNNTATPTTLSVAKGATGSFSIYIDGTTPLSAYLLNIDVKGNNNIHLYPTMNLYVDNVKPSVVIDNPANDAEVSGLVNINATVTDVKLGGIVFEVYPEGLCNNGQVSPGIVYENSLNDSIVWNSTMFCDADYIIKVIGTDEAGNSGFSTINVTLNNGNEAPVVVSAIADFAILEDTIDNSTINLSKVFFDIDGDSLNYIGNIVAGDGNLTVDVDTTSGGVILTPAANYSGVFIVEFNATDGSLTASDSVIITVTEVNDVPSVPLVGVPANDTSIKTSIDHVSLQWSFSDDVESNTLDYNLYFSEDINNIPLLVTLPFARYIDGSEAEEGPQYDITSLVNGTTYFWQVTASDGINQSAKSEVFEFTYFLDSAPSIVSWYWETVVSNSTTDEAFTSQEGLPIYFEAYIEDPEMDNLTGGWILYNQSGGKDTRQNFNITGNGTVNVTFVPGLLDGGNTTFRLYVKDVNDNYVRQDWNLTITDNNQQPQIVSVIPNVVTAEDTNATVLNVSQYFMDPDTDNTLTYVVTQQNPSQVSCVINGANLVIAPATNWNGVGASAASCSVAANDGIVNSIDNTFLINVTAVQDAPVVIVGDVIDADEDVELSYTISANDPDGDLISTFWSDSSLFSVNSSTGVFRYTPTLSQVGNHSITFYANDTNGNIGSKTATLIVHYQNHVPTLNPIGNKTVNEGASLQFTISAQDIDLTYGDVLTFTSSIPGMTINKIGPGTAEIYWVATSEYEGSNLVEFKVTDSQGVSSSRTITISVEGINYAPTITSYVPNYNPKITEDGTQSFQIGYNDRDGDIVNVSWYADGELKGTGNSFVFNANGAAGVNDRSIVAVVSDGVSNVSRSWTLTTSDVPLSNVYTTPITSLSANALGSVTGITIENQYGKIDFGSSAINLSNVVDLDRFVMINSGGVVGVDTNKFPTLRKPATVTMKGLTHTETPVIYYNAGFGVSGTTVCPATKCSNINYSNGVLTFNVNEFSTFWVTTITTNYPPIITSTPIAGAKINNLYVYDVNAVDPDNNPVTYSLDTFPTGMQIDAITGVISWTPTAIGDYNVVVSVSDGIAAPVTQSFTVYVTETGIAPGQSMLAITDLDISVNGKTDKNLNNGEKIGENAVPEAEIEFEIEIKNLFDDLKIENINVNIAILDIDDGDDIEEDSSDFDLKAGKDENVVISLKLPLMIEEGTYDVLITVEGEDEDGGDHDVKWDLLLDVDKETYELRIVNSAVSPATVKCGRNAIIDLEVVNTGTKDEEDVRILVSSQELGINIEEKDIQLDNGADKDDSAYDRQFQITLPEGVKVGVYPIQINVYRDYSRLMDSETINLAFEECIQQVEVEEPVNVELITTPDYPTIPGQVVNKPTKITFRESDEYLMLLAVSMVIMIGIVTYGIGAVVILSRKKKY